MPKKAQRKRDDALYEAVLKLRRAGYDVKLNGIRLAGIVADRKRIHLVDGKHYTTAQLVSRADEIDAQQSLEFDMPLQFGNPRLIR